MSTPLFDETVMAVGLNLPTFERVDSHEDFLLKHEFRKWLDDTLAAVASHVPAEKQKRPRKKP